MSTHLNFSTWKENSPRTMSAASATNIKYVNKFRLLYKDAKGHNPSIDRTGTHLSSKRSGAFSQITHRALRCTMYIGLEALDQKSVTDLLTDTFPRTSLFRCFDSLPKVTDLLKSIRWDMLEQVYQLQRASPCWCLVFPKVQFGGTL